jgi:biotin carboxylase
MRARVGLPGQSVACAVAFRDKIRMKTLASASDIRVPAFSRVDTPRQLVAFADEHPYPLVLKPRAESGSAGVTFLPDEAALRAALASGLLPAAPDRSGYLMVEEFVDADFFHVDGIMVGGRVVHCWPSAYSTGNAEATQGSLPITSWQLRVDDPRNAALRSFTARVIRALPPADLPLAFHLEAWLPQDGEPILCEVACRPAGGGLPAAYERAFGVHLAREGLRGQSGLPLAQRSQPTRPDPYTGLVAFTPRRGTFVAREADCPVEGVELTVRAASGTVYTGDHHAGDGVALAVIMGDDPSAVRERIDALLAWWQSARRWL